jgi:UrcA family protein
MRTVLITVAFAALAAPAFAREGGDLTGAPEAAVQHQDLDLTNERDAEILLRRLARTAAAVCAVPEVDRPSPALRRQIETCRQEAIAIAVDRLGAPAVARAYQNRLSEQAGYRR